MDLMLNWAKSNGANFEGFSVDKDYTGYRVVATRDIQVFSLKEKLKFSQMR